VRPFCLSSGNDKNCSIPATHLHPIRLIKPTSQRHAERVRSREASSSQCRAAQTLPKTSNAWSDSGRSFTAGRLGWYVESRNTSRKFGHRPHSRQCLGAHRFAVRCEEHLTGALWLLGRTPSTTNLNQLIAASASTHEIEYRPHGADERCCSIVNDHIVTKSRFQFERQNEIIIVSDYDGSRDQRAGRFHGGGLLLASRAATTTRASNSRT